MSKDEYLLTDTPLKALTVFAMPMILGSFFQHEYSCAVTPQVRQTGNRLSGPAGTAYASLLT